MRTNVPICQIHNVPRRTLRMPDVEQELLTLQEHRSSPPIFRDVRVSLSLVFCLVLCRSLFVLLSFCAWILYYLSFDFRLSITSLVSSTFPSMSSFILILRLSYVFMNILLLICLGLTDVKLSCFPSISMYFPVCRYWLRKDSMTSVSLSLSLSLPIIVDCRYCPHFNIFINEYRRLVSCVQHNYFAGNKHILQASLITICCIKENESNRIYLKDNMEVECVCCNIHIQSFGN